jgi:rare lipoprotein A
MSGGGADAPIRIGGNRTRAPRFADGRRTKPMRHHAVVALAVLATSSAIPAAYAQDAGRPPLKVEVAPDGEPMLVQEGEASFYGPGFHGRTTASGETFDQDAPTAASRDLPLGVEATVEHQGTGSDVDVRVNDRGPYAGERVIDLSKGAAGQIGMTKDGVGDVRVEVKPSDQPTQKAREKVEDKVEEVARQSGTPLPDDRVSER